MTSKALQERSYKSLRQGDQAREILVADPCGAQQNLRNEQNFPMG